MLHRWMRIWQVLKHRRYNKILISIILSIVATALCLSVSLIINFQSSSSYLIQSYMADQLSQFRYAVDHIFFSARTEMVHYASNPDVLKLCNYTKMSELQLYTTLQNIAAIEATGSTPYVCFYNGASERIFFQGKNYPVSEFPDQDLVSYLTDSIDQTGEYFLSRTTTDYDLYSNSQNTVLPETSNVYTFLYYNSSPSPSAVVLNIPISYLQEAVDDLSNMQEEVVILDESGRVQFSVGQYPFLSNLSGEASFQRILTDEKEQSYFLADIGGQRCLISYISSETTLNWRYIRITPYASISAQLEQALKKSLFIVLGILLPLLIAGLTLARWLYRGYQAQMSQMEQQYRERSRHNFPAQQRFLLSLVQNNAPSGEKLWKQIRKYDLQFERKFPFRLVLFAIDHYNVYSDRVDTTDRDLYSYGIMNILSETFMPAGTVHAIQYQESYYLLLCNGPNNALSPQKWIELASKAQESIAQFLSLSLSVIIGTPGIELSDIRSEVHQCIEAANYRIFRGERMIAFLSEITETQSSAYLPSAIDFQRLIDNLLLGKKEDVLEQCHSLLNAPHEYSYDSLKVFLLKLLFQIQEAVESKGGEENFSHIDDWMHYISTLSGETSLSEIEEWLTDFINLALENLRQAQNEQHMNAAVSLENVQALLEREYSNPDLTPEYLANQYNLSSNYFKRLFKANTGMSISEFINSIRLKKAAECLATTQNTSADIAQKCGFININYFYTLFKKKFGITPTEYRQIHMKDPS